MGRSGVGQHAAVSSSVARFQLGAVVFPLLALCVSSQIILARFFSGLDGSEAHRIADVLPVVVLLAVPGLALVVATSRFNKLNATQVAIASVFAAGLIMRLWYFGTDPILESDHYRYLWDGALVAHGLSPYAYSPASALAGNAEGAVRELASAGSTVLTRINFPELRSIYPGTAALAFGLAHLLAPWKVDGLRIVILVAELATFLLLLVWLKELGKSPLLAALYWANPLVVFCFAGQAHVDALMPPLLLGALLLLRRGHLQGVAGSMIGAAVGVKLWPVLIVPLGVAAVWPERKKAGRFLAAFVIVSLISVAPLLISSLKEGSGLVAYGTQWANNNALYAWTLTLLEQVGAASPAAKLLLRGLLAATVAVTAAFVAFRILKKAMTLVSAALILTATLFYLSPAQFPWYAIWFLPFATLQANKALLLSSATLPSYFLFFPLALQDETWFFMHFVSLVHAVPVLLWLLFDWNRQRA